MKFVPRHTQIVGRTVIEKPRSSIIALNETKNITKFMFIDAVGPGAAKVGLKVGDVVVSRAHNNIIMNGGSRFRPVIDEKDVLLFVTGVGLEALYVQTENGQEFVSFDDEKAAKSMGENPPPSDEAEAAE